MLPVVGQGDGTPAAEAAAAIIQAVSLMGAHSAALPFILRALQPFLAEGTERNTPKSELLMPHHSGVSYSCL